MNKIFLALLMCFCALGLKAQYGSINEILDRLEERRGINRDLKHINLDDTKFVLIKDFEDHTERNIIIIKGNIATYVELFDDKRSGMTSSNIFSGDVVRTKHNILSVRADKLEGERIAAPVIKSLLITQQKKMLYLIDVNTGERWISEDILTKK
ncbi:MAG: hypothetical protein K0M63_04095 [Weeksellaceae bacterium]|nr:hypothetical protein [Weeksellaceae bacterium]